MLHRIHNGCQLPGQNGFRSTLDDPATSSNGNVADEHCAAGGPDPTAAAPAQPDRVTRWVRQALQQSWGAWLAGGESTAAWDVCRQGATDADAAFMEDVRRMAWQADSQPAQHTQEGVPMEGSLGNLGNLGVLPADMNSSGAIMSPVHRRRWSDGNDLGSLREFEGWDSIHADGADASPWLAGEAMDGLQQAVGAVVDDGDRLVGGLAATEHQGCLRSGAAEMPLPERRFQGHGPELCSYIYGHVRPCCRPIMYIRIVDVALFPVCAGRVALSTSITPVRTSSFRRIRAWGSSAMANCLGQSSLSRHCDRLECIEASVIGRFSYGAALAALVHSHRIRWAYVVACADITLSLVLPSNVSLVLWHEGLGSCSLVKDATLTPPSSPALQSPLGPTRSIGRLSRSVAQSMGCTHSQLSSESSRLSSSVRH